MPDGRPRSSFLPKALTLLAILVKGTIGFWAARSPAVMHFGDVGQWVDAGDRLLAGQLPFRDFFGWYGPLLYCWSAVFYRLAGANWFAALLTLDVISPVCCLLLIYYVATRALKGIWFQLLFIAAAALIGLDHFFWSPALRVWLPLASFVFAQRALRAGGGSWRLAAAGVFIGAGPFLSVDSGLAAWAALAALAAGVAAFEPRRRTAAALMAATLLPSAVALLFFPRGLAEYARTMRGAVGITNWNGGVLFPRLLPPSAAALLFWGPLVFVAVAGAWLAFRALKRAAPASRRDDLEDLALALFSAALIRSTLGRSDYAHLMFALPPIILLWTRLWERAGPARSAAGLIAAAGLIPFAVKSRADRLAWPVYAVSSEFSGGGQAEWSREGIRASAAFVSRARGVAAEIERLTRPGDLVLSLPLPLYAHAAGRASALPFYVADLLMIRADFPEKVLARLEDQRTSLVVLDPLMLADPTPEEAAHPLEGRLTWASKGADEVATRELREYLRSRFAPARELDGVAYLVRRAKPLPALRESVVFQGGGWSGSGGEDAHVVPVPGVRCDEIRVALRLDYPPLLASLAKPILIIDVLFGAGEASGGSVLPVPPGYLGRDIRIPVRKRPIRGVVIQVISPGALNPSPRSITIDSVRFVARH